MQVNLLFISKLTIKYPKSDKTPHFKGNLPLICCKMDENKG